MFDLPFIFIGSLKVFKRSKHGGREGGKRETHIKRDTKTWCRWSAQINENVVM